MTDKPLVYMLWDSFRVDYTYIKVEITLIEGQEYMKPTIISREEAELMVLKGKTDKILSNP